MVTVPFQNHDQFGMELDYRLTFTLLLDNYIIQSQLSQNEFDCEFRFFLNFIFDSYNILNVIERIIYLNCKK